MKRISCALIALIILLCSIGSFCACRDEQPVPEEAPKLPIIQNEVSNYIIVYPDYPTTTEVDVAQMIKDKIHDVTGVRIKSMNEEFMDDESEKNVIYIGDTTFEPAKTAKTQILQTYFDAYVIDVSDKDIYIVGASDTALFNGVSYFIENLVEKNYEASTKTLYFEGCQFSGKETTPAGFCLQNIRDYAIVYSGEKGFNHFSIAQKLQGLIKDQTGFSPEIYRDSDKEEGRFEILVGETNRPLSARSYQNTGRIMEYEFIVDQSKLQLAFGGYYSAEKCLNEFSMRVLKYQSAVLATGSYYANLIANISQPLTEGADIRIMSANVMAYRWGEGRYSNVLPIAQRCEIFAGVLLKYRPDAVGIQEVDDPWLEVLPWYLDRLAKKDGLEYTHLFANLTYENKTMVNFSSLVYRSDLYQVDDSGCEVFSIWDATPDYFQRVASYVKLTSKTDVNKDFILVNTHWAHENEEYVNACATEQAALVNRLKGTYSGVPIFCTGDYNNLSTREWRDRFLLQFASSVNGKIASDIARTKGVLITPGGCRAKVEKMHENVFRDIDDSFIDHIVCTGGAYDILRHDTIRTNGCHVLSDHSPIYADISLS